MSDHMNDCCGEQRCVRREHLRLQNADGKRCHADHIQVKNTQGTCTCKTRRSGSTFQEKGRAAF